ncbi:uncharacterized protein LOC127450271 [Myxocyprinus asiaticus]|uniref:uncharacterized protein LOC127450271 n=1 Tax=Myxocyprinus asiaticus TaxID=70543 RepID=UPI0022227876|nr:uncharacterized protein LOC127450271 [Myxocyprinus asiaticus]
MNTTIETTDQGVSNNKSDPASRPVKNHSNGRESRPDWLLYTVPASAFFIGVVLFALVHKTQRRRKSCVVQGAHTNGHFATHSGKDMQGYIQSDDINMKDETQSYENVEAAIYNNQEKVTYYCPEDQDYLTPDALGEEEGVGPKTHQHTLQLPTNLTDTDGESYENMEGCLYAQPRKCSRQIKHTTEVEESYGITDDSNFPCKDFLGAHDTTEDDYINPDEDGQKELAMGHTDTESYEMMAGPDFPFDGTGANDTTEDDSYEQMNGIPVPYQREMDGWREGE